MFKRTLKKDNRLEISCTEQFYNLKGPLGETSLLRSPFYDLEITPKSIIIKTEEKKYDQLFFSIFKANIRGVLFGFIKSLNLVGIGYSAEVNTDNVLILNLGYSHKILIEIPKDIFIKVKKKKKILILGNNLEKISQFALQIKLKRVPDCYKGKGVFYKKEKITLKVGKKE